MSTPKQKIFINSLPKSGTHLLSKSVDLFGYQEHFDPENLDDSARVTPLFFNYREVKNAIAKLDIRATKTAPEPAFADEEPIYVGTLTPVYANATHFRQWFEAMPIDSYILGHVGYSPQLSHILEELDMAHLFIIRDPRAVIVSLLSFIMDTKGMPCPHFLQEDFNEMSPQQRLDLILEGGYAPKADEHVTAFADVYQTMFGWHNDPRCLVVRFEELVGPQGGGTFAQQQAMGQQIAAHINMSFGNNIADRFEEIYNPASRTFREGKIGGWEDELDAASIAKITRYCEPLCQAAGYSIA